jgi:DNA polymerase (family 10)
MVSTIGDIDIAVATENPEAVIDYFVNFPKRKEIIEKGPSGATITLNNETQVDLRVQSPERFGAMLQYFTGSKAHNIHLREFALKKGLSLSEYGIKSLNKTQNSKLKAQNYNSMLKIYQFADEISFYNALGLPWIPPEIREDSGEIEAALRQVQGKPSGLPDLIQLSDIKGDLHIHSNYNLEPSHDLGTSSIEEILGRAQELGYEYVGISDHNPSQVKHSNNQLISILKLLE